MKRTKFGDKVASSAKAKLIEMPRDQRSERLDEKLTKEEDAFERDFIIGCIVDDAVCKWAKENFPPKAIKSSTGRKLLYWTLEFYDAYGEKAPKSYIGQHVFSKESTFSDGETEWIEGVLGSMSKEWAEEKKGEINPKYLIRRAEHYREKIAMKERAGDILDLIENNEIEKAQELFQYEPLTTSNLSGHFISFPELEKRDIEAPRMLMKPWLREGETNLLYSWTGVGKSWFAMIISWLLACENYKEKECEFAGWQVKNPCGTLYLDGELGQSDMTDRLRKLKWLGAQLPNMEMRIFNLPEYRKDTGNPFDLSNRKCQQAIIDFFKKNPDYRHLVIDSVSTLFRLDDENSNSEWHNKVQPFLIDLRGLGVTQLVQHHAGKDGKMRGASAEGTIAANIIRCVDHPQKTPGQAYFTVSFGDKQRAAGDANKPITVRLLDFDDRVEWQEEEWGSRGGDKKLGIIANILMGKSNKEIAEMFDCKSPYVSQLKTEAKKLRYLDREGSATKAGLGLVEEYGDDGAEPIG